ncbi:MAG: hypothetical protein ACOYMA_06460 [Bacteroidia bacterium]
MGTSLYLITNSKLTGNETQKDWDGILESLKNLNLETNSYLNEKNETVKETGEWYYHIIDEEEMPYHICFEGPFNFCPEFYRNIGIISTIYRYGLLYNIYYYDWFKSFRNELFNIVKIMGGTEVIYLPDSGSNNLVTYLESMAWENMPYELVKQKMMEELGPPVTDYSKLNIESLNFKNIPEFFLDDFADLK